MILRKMRDLIEKIRFYFRFNNEEVKSIAIISIVLGFSFAFQDFSILKLIYAAIIVALSIFVHVSIQKIVSLHVGFLADFKMWWTGLIIGLIITFLSNGRVWWLLLPGGLTFSIFARHRLGKFRYGLNYWPMGIIALSGIIASIAFGTIFKNIELYIFGSSVPFLASIFTINLVLAICSMIPIPPLDGHYIFFASRLWFALLFGTIFAYSILTLVFEIYSWVWAIIFGLIVWAAYYIKMERQFWV
jgi:Zn-dependent protease